MPPLSQLRTVTPETAALEALAMMSREDINQLPVVSDGRLGGSLLSQSCPALPVHTCRVAPRLTRLMFAGVSIDRVARRLEHSREEAR